VGDPHPQIIKTAEDGKFDLIVMGHRGLNPLQRLFIGSVAKRVIEDTPCSVLVIK
jgi:nucleotide-binding universal stress UspA family protein